MEVTVIVREGGKARTSAAKHAKIAMSWSSLFSLTGTPQYRENIFTYGAVTFSFTYRVGVRAVAVALAVALAVAVAAAVAVGGVGVVAGAALAALAVAPLLIFIEDEQQVAS
jgi:hypothetical protein